MDTKWVPSIRESVIEKYLVEQIALMQGEAYKFTSPGRRGVLDRLCVLPYGVIAFVEVKAPSKELTAAQTREVQRLKQKGHIAVRVRSFDDVNNLVKQLGEVVYERIRNSKRVKKNDQFEREETDPQYEQSDIPGDLGGGI